jgi:hypothetical protein
VFDDDEGRRPSALFLLACLVVFGGAESGPGITPEKELANAGKLVGLTVPRRDI